jgi:hypothetical protein
LSPPPSPSPSTSQVRKGTLRFTDIHDDPERFFLAHRLLAKHAPEHGPGFWIRFTVQFNLFAGSVVALGGPQQLAGHRAWRIMLATSSSISQTLVS